MNGALIFLPPCALVLLTYAVMFSLFLARLAGMKENRASFRSLADPVREAQVFVKAADLSDNFENLFEMPLLLFIASLVIFVLTKVDAIYLALTWSYVLLRFLHSAIHCIGNRVKYRFHVFFLSALVLLAIWIRIAEQILIS